MKPQIKTFRSQYTECKNAGLIKAGTVMKFKDHPELLPMPWHPDAVENVQRLLKENPDEGLTPVMCGRFGGQCKSNHPLCRKLRNITGN